MQEGCAWNQMWLCVPVGLTAIREGAEQEISQCGLSAPRPRARHLCPPQILGHLHLRACALWGAAVVSLGGACHVWVNVVTNPDQARETCLPPELPNSAFHLPQAS